MKIMEISAKQQKRSPSEYFLDGITPAKIQPFVPFTGPAEAPLVGLVTTPPETSNVQRPLDFRTLVADSRVPAPVPFTSVHRDVQEKQVSTTVKKIRSSSQVSAADFVIGWGEG